jgi:hypothetical protein
MIHVRRRIDVRRRMHVRYTHTQVPELMLHVDIA